MSKPSPDTVMADTTKQVISEAIGKMMDSKPQTAQEDSLQSVNEKYSFMQRDATVESTLKPKMHSFNLVMLADPEVLVRIAEQIDSHVPKKEWGYVNKKVFKAFENKQPLTKKEQAILTVYDFNSHMMKIHMTVKKVAFMESLLKENEMLMDLVLTLKTKRDGYNSPRHAPKQWSAEGEDKPSMEFRQAEMRRHRRQRHSKRNLNMPKKMRQLHRHRMMVVAKKMEKADEQPLEANMDEFGNLLGGSETTKYPPINAHPQEPHQNDSYAEVFLCVTEDSEEETLDK